MTRRTAVATLLLGASLVAVAGLLGPGSVLAAGPTPIDEAQATVDEAERASQVHYTFTGSDSVTFDWQGTPTSIRYGLTTAYGMVATASEPVPVPSSSPGPFREVRLSGLAPDTEYHYAIGDGPDHAFHTRPAGEYRVVAVGDIGDSGTYPWIAPLMSQVAAADPSFVLALGDLTYANINCAQAVDQHFDDVQAWSVRAAYMPVWGNHEYARAAPDSPCGIDDTFANYKGRFALPNQQTISANGPQTSTGPGCPLVDGTNPCQGEDWYWFDSPPVRYVVGPEPFDGAVDEWRDQVQPIMSAAADDPAIRFVVTATHKPAYSSTGRTTADYRSAIDALGEQFPEYVLHLSGHVHANEVFEPQHGVTHVTAGAGGEGLDRLPAPVDGSVFQLQHTGFAVLDVTTDGIRLDVVCGPDIAADFPPDSCATGETVASFDVTDRPPTAAWTAACDADLCRFDASASSDRDGTISSYEWDFGDGTGGSGIAPEHTFAGPGVYPVRLTVTDDHLNTDDDQQLVSVGALGTVGFRAATEASGRARAHRVTVPGEVRRGDGLLAFLSVNSTSRTVTPPGRWRLVDTVTDSRLETTLWQRTAGRRTAGRPIRFLLDRRAKATTTLVAYHGTSASAPVGAVRGNYETGPSTTHTTPRLRLATEGAGLVSYWADRSTSTTGWTLPAGVVSRSQSAGTGTGHTSAAAGDLDGPVSPGTAGGQLAEASSRSHHATMVTVLLAPGS